MEINPVSISTRYQYLDQYAMGGQVIAKKELPWKLMIIGVAALVVTICVLKDLKYNELETSGQYLTNTEFEE